MRRPQSTKLKANAGWRLDPAEVTWGTKSTTIGGRGRARDSRAGTITDFELTLTHIPTGTAVRGEVPRGRRSRAEMRLLREKLWPQLFRALEIQVARRLRVPGR